ncbi:MAG TPA: hypothetical protein VEP90_29740 [Methylomirabilota bacterium]|nr:hypothetical protein [Methylomirabilota bacterium]
MTTNYPGIDYSLGLANVDSANGIHYGVISQHSVLQAWADSAEPDYGEPHCPKCGGDVVEAHICYNSLVDGDKHWSNLYSHGIDDYACENCEVYLDSADVFGDEPCAWGVDDGEYLLTDCLDSDVFVLKSPYYTFAQYCSPCVPGAGNLNSYCENGVKTYCLGHDWFDDGKAPYPVYSVETNKEVAP